MSRSFASTCISLPNFLHEWEEINQGLIGIALESFRAIPFVLTTRSPQHASEGGVRKAPHPTSSPNRHDESESKKADRSNGNDGNDEGDHSGHEGSTLSAAPTTATEAYAQVYKLLAGAGPVRGEHDTQSNGAALRREARRISPHADDDSTSGSNSNCSDNDSRPNESDGGEDGNVHRARQRQRCVYSRIELMLYLAHVSVWLWLALMSLSTGGRLQLPAAVRACLVHAVSNGGGDDGKGSLAALLAATPVVAEPASGEGAASPDEVAGQPTQLLRDVFLFQMDSATDCSRWQQCLRRTILAWLGAAAGEGVAHSSLASCAPVEIHGCTKQADGDNISTTHDGPEGEETEESTGRALDTELTDLVITMEQMLSLHALITAAQHFFPFTRAISVVFLRLGLALEEAEATHMHSYRNNKARHKAHRNENVGGVQVYLDVLQEEWNTILAKDNSGSFTALWPLPDRRSGPQQHHHWGSPLISRNSRGGVQHGVGIVPILLRGALRAVLVANGPWVRRVIACTARAALGGGELVMPPVPSPTLGGGGGIPAMNARGETHESCDAPSGEVDRAATIARDWRTAAAYVEEVDMRNVHHLHAMVELSGAADLCDWTIRVVEESCLACGRRLLNSTLFTAMSVVTHLVHDDSVDADGDDYGGDGNVQAGYASGLSGERANTREERESRVRSEHAVAAAASRPCGKGSASADTAHRTIITPRTSRTPISTIGQQQQQPYGVFDRNVALVAEQMLEHVADCDALDMARTGSSALVPIPPPTQPMQAAAARLAAANTALREILRAYIRLRAALMLFNAGTPHYMDALTHGGRQRFILGMRAFTDGLCSPRDRNHVLLRGGGCRRSNSNGTSGGGGVDDAVGGSAMNASHASSTSTGSTSKTAAEAALPPAMCDIQQFTLVYGVPLWIQLCEKTKRRHIDIHQAANDGAVTQKSRPDAQGSLTTTGVVESGVEGPPASGTVAAATAHAAVGPGPLSQHQLQHVRGGFDMRRARNGDHLLATTNAGGHEDDKQSGGNDKCESANGDRGYEEEVEEERNESDRRTATPPSSHAPTEAPAASVYTRASAAGATTITTNAQDARSFADALSEGTSVKLGHARQAWLRHALGLDDEEGEEERELRLMASLPEDGLPTLLALLTRNESHRRLILSTFSAQVHRYLVMLLTRDGGSGNDSRSNSKDGAHGRTARTNSRAAAVEPLPSCVLEKCVLALHMTHSAFSRAESSDSHRAAAGGGSGNANTAASGSPALAALAATATDAVVKGLKGFFAEYEERVSLTLAYALHAQVLEDLAARTAASATTGAGIGAKAPAGSMNSAGEVLRGGEAGPPATAAAPGNSTAALQVVDTLLSLASMLPARERFVRDYKALLAPRLLHSRTAADLDVDAKVLSGMALRLGAAVSHPCLTLLYDLRLSLASTRGLEPAFATDADPEPRRDENGEEVQNESGQHPEHLGRHPAHHHRSRRHHKDKHRHSRRHHRRGRSAHCETGSDGNCNNSSSNSDPGGGGDDPYHESSPLGRRDVRNGQSRAGATATIGGTPPARAASRFSPPQPASRINQNSNNDNNGGDGNHETPFEESVAAQPRPLAAAARVAATLLPSSLSRTSPTLGAARSPVAYALSLLSGTAASTRGGGVDSAHLDNRSSTLNHAKGLMCVPLGYTSPRLIRQLRVLCEAWWVPHVGPLLSPQHIQRLHEKHHFFSDTFVDAVLRADWYYCGPPQEENERPQSDDVDRREQMRSLSSLCANNAMPGSRYAAVAPFPGYGRYHYRPPALPVTPTNSNHNRTTSYDSGAAQSRRSPSLLSASQASSTLHGLGSALTKTVQQGASVVGGLRRTEHRSGAFGNDEPDDDDDEDFLAAYGGVLAPHHAHRSSRGGRTGTAAGSIDELGSVSSFEGYRASLTDGNGSTPAASTATGEGDGFVGAASSAASRRHETTTLKASERTFSPDGTLARRRLHWPMATGQLVFLVHPRTGQPGSGGRNGNRSSSNGSGGTYYQVTGPPIALVLLQLLDHRRELGASLTWLFDHMPVSHIPKLITVTMLKTFLAAGLVERRVGSATGQQVYFIPDTFETPMKAAAAAGATASATADRSGLQRPQQRRRTRKDAEEGNRRRKIVVDLTNVLQMMSAQAGQGVSDTHDAASHHAAVEAATPAGNSQGRAELDALLPSSNSPTSVARGHGFSGEIEADTCTAGATTTPITTTTTALAQVLSPDNSERQRLQAMESIIITLLKRAGHMPHTALTEAVAARAKESYTPVLFKQAMGRLLERDFVRRDEEAKSYVYVP